MKDDENKNQLVPIGKQPLARVSKTLAITNKLLNEIENREPSDDFRVAIPDEASQEYLKDIGVNVENGTVAYGEVKGIEKIECSSFKISDEYAVPVNGYWSGGFINDWKIKSLEGLNYFKNSKVLDCSGHQLTTLDVSKNINLKSLDCSDNQLKSLDVSRNINLEILRCSGNEFVDVDTSNNPKLKTKII